jgi:hypothetical protein
MPVSENILKKIKSHKPANEPYSWVHRVTKPIHEPDAIAELAPMSATIAEPTPA